MLVALQRTMLPTGHISLVLSWRLEGSGGVCLGGTGFFVGPWGTPMLCGASHSFSEGQSPALSRAVCLQIREEIDHYGIRIYQFPECDSDEDEEFKLQDQALKVGLAPPAPSLEGQSPVAGRTCHPGVPLGLFGAPQALRQPQRGVWYILHYPDVSPRPCRCHLKLGGMGLGWRSLCHDCCCPT